MMYGIAQHVGFSLKYKDPTYETFGTEELGSHTLFPKIVPHSCKDKTLWYHFLNINVCEFDESDPLCLVTQMEHFFPLRRLKGDLQKLKIRVLYLDFE